MKMSISYGIKPDWTVVLRTKENVHRLAYHLQVIEGVIDYMKDPQDYFNLNELETKQVNTKILPILTGNTWNYTTNMPMTDEEARNVGYLIYVLGHQNWYTCIHKDNFRPTP